MDPGKRDQLITFERATVTVDDYGGETPDWDEFAQAWARVRYGTGQERREAAQERAIQAATFECDWSQTLTTITKVDRLVVEGEAWDIVSSAPVSHREIHFAAVRTDAGVALPPISLVTTTLELNGQTLQLNGQDLVLGA